MSSLGKDSNDSQQVPLQNAKLQCLWFGFLYLPPVLLPWCPRLLPLLWIKLLRRLMLL
jgi:hypothetical protein